jgi:hypothetical protein
MLSALCIPSVRRLLISTPLLCCLPACAGNGQKSDQSAAHGGAGWAILRAERRLGAAPGWLEARARVVRLSLAAALVASAVRMRQAGARVLVGALAAKTPVPAAAPGSAGAEVSRVPAARADSRPAVHTPLAEPAEALVVPRLVARAAREAPAPSPEPRASIA